MLAALATANVLSFGNGGVMVALLQHSLVQETHALSNDQLLYAFAIARVTPGPANLYVASIAYMLFGLPGAILSMVVIAAPGYLMVPLMGGYRHFQHNQAVHRLTRGLAATAVGVILATTWEVGKGSLAAPVSWVVFGVALALLLLTRLPTLVSLFVATGIGVAAVLAVPGAG